MDEQTAAILTALIESLGNDSHDCGNCCDCTTVRSFEQTAARANEQAAFASAESQKQFLQQQAMFWAKQLKD